MANKLGYAESYIRSCISYANAVDLLDVMYPGIVHYLLTGFPRISLERTIALTKMPHHEIMDILNLVKKRDESALDMLPSRAEIRSKSVKSPPSYTLGVSIELGEEELNMPRRYLEQPTILIDPQKSRIRIYRNTLHIIGDPEYILFVVTPHEQSLTISRSEKTDRRACFLGRSTIDSNLMPEVFNKTLVQDLFDINECWDKRKAYRVYGKISSNRDAVIFNCSDSALFLGEREWQM